MELHVAPLRIVRRDIYVVPELVNGGEARRRLARHEEAVRVEQLLARRVVADDHVVRSLRLPRVQQDAAAGAERGGGVGQRGAAARLLTAALVDAVQERNWHGAG